MKRRFHCLGSTLRCELDRVPSIIVVRFILHNQAKRLRNPEFEGEDVEDDDFPDLTDRTDNYLRIRGQQKRYKMVNLLYC